MLHRVPKLCGADIELANFIYGLDRPNGTGGVASRALLSRIPGIRTESRLFSGCNCPQCRERRQREQESFSRNDAIDTSNFNSQDSGRKFLPSNGGCAYIDLDHCELCLPEVRSAHDHVAAWHAMLRITQKALGEVAVRLPDGQTLLAMANNSDGLGHSYGSHLDLMLSRRAWDNLFHRKIHYLLHLASFQVASLIFTGQGKVGAENGAPAVGYQIGQRADYFETLQGSQTTYHRPIVNARDEALAGDSEATADGEKVARLHVIFYDNTLCPVASLLKIGLLQIKGAMLETGRANLALVLDDPVESVVRFSHDPTLKVKAPLTDGREVTMVELMRMFLDEMAEFVQKGECEGYVPRANEIVALADDTLTKLAAGDFLSVAGRLDWVLKQQILQQALDQYPQLTWESPEIKHLDHQYSNLDPNEGLYWAYDREGIVEHVVSPEDVERLTSAPPDDSRAYTRAWLLRMAGPSQVTHVDWDRMEFSVPKNGTGSVTQWKLDMSDPLAFTREKTARLFDGSRTLAEVLEQLGATTDRGRKDSRSDGGLVRYQGNTTAWWN